MKQIKNILNNELLTLSMFIGTIIILLGNIGAVVFIIVSNDLLISGLLVIGMVIINYYLFSTISANYKQKILDQKIEIEFYTLVINIHVSDSGDGPFTDTRYIINCFYKDGIWYSNKSKLPVLDDPRFRYDTAFWIEIRDWISQPRFYND